MRSYVLDFKYIEFIREYLKYRLNVIKLLIGDDVASFSLEGQ